MFLRCERSTCPSLAIVLGVILVTIAIIIPTNLAAQTPLASWSFDEGSGRTVFDGSGHGRNGTLSNGIRWTHDDNRWAIAADVTSKGYVTIPAIDLHQTKAVSIGLWAKRDISASLGAGVLITGGNKEGPGFALSFDDAACHGLRAAEWGNGGSTANCYAAPSSGAWHQFVVIYDETRTAGDAVALYVDGVLQAPTWNPSTASNTDGFGESPIYLFSQDGTSQFSSGAVRDLRIYDTALSAESVQQLYAEEQESAVPSSGLVASYAFDEGSGPTVTDGSGNGNTGTIANGAWTEDGKYGKALVFNGTNSLITVPDSPSLHLKDSMTLEAWVSPSVVNGLWRDVLDKGSDYSLEGTSAGQGAPAVGAMLASSRALSYGTAPLPANTWSHLAVTYDGSLLRTYVNGVLVSSRVSQGEIASSSNPLQIGGDRIFGRYFEGKIDEIRIYDIALTQAQIKSDLVTPVKAQLLSITVSPQGQAIEVGDQLQFTATGNYSDGRQQDVTNSASWTSSASAIASVSRSGIVQGVSAGNATLQAMVGSVSGSGDINIGPARFTISASPSSLTVAQGNQGTSTITTAIYNGFKSAIMLSASGVPSGTTVSFNPNPIPSPGAGSSTMTINVGANTAVGTYPITVTGSGGSTQAHSATVTLTVTAPAADYSITANPSAVTIAQGQQGSSTISTAIVGSFNSSISLSASGVPTGTTVSFNPNPIPAPGNGSSAMTINVGANTALGTYPITVTGKGGGIQHSTTVTLTVTSNGGIALDGGVHGVADSGSTSTNTESVSIGTPSAGDLITCEVTFDSGNNNALVSISDNNNGTYAAAVPMHLNSSMVQWFGIYYKENVSGSPTTVTLKTTKSQPYEAIACQAWKGAASANSLDTGFSQLKDAVSAPNPATGSNKTPAANGALVIAAVGLINSGAPTPGTNYGLIDGASVTKWWPEYWIQTTATATAGNYTRSSDTWTDMMAAFLPVAGGDFSVSASPTSLSVVQGGQGSSTISTTISGGFNSAIDLTASGVPNGTTVSFAPNPIAAPGSGSSTMTINVGANTAVGTYPITVTGNGGGIQHSTTVTLTVTAPADYTITANPSAVSVVQGSQGNSTITTTISGGFNSAITLSASGVPTGTTVSFNPNPIAAPGNGSSTMTINVGANTAVGTYPITVTGNGGGIQHSTTVTLTVTAPADYTITANPSAVSVVQGSQGSSTITTTISGGFNSAITLSASGVPTGTTVSFNPNPIAAPGNGSSTMTINVGANTAVGTYPITVTGNGGGIQHSTTVTLTVTAPADYTITANPSAVSVVQGGQGSSTITTTISGGFNSAISLTASGVPNGTTVSFNPNPIAAPGNGSSAMTINVGANTAVGTYPITVTGSGGGVQHSTTVTLTVTAIGGGVALDGNVHGVQDSGSNSTNTESVSIGTPTAGDLITCQVTFDSGNSNALVSVSDNNNGTYAAAVPMHLNSSMVQWFGIYYKENVSGSPTTVTIKTTKSQPYVAIACQAWKGVAAANSLDAGFAQLQDAVSVPNPTTGSNKTPVADGELVIAAVGLINSGAPTPGSNYSLIDGATATRWWPEYWIQTTATATAGNYTRSSDTWTDMMAAFLPAASANFSISASPTSLSVVQGSQGSSTISTSISGGFSSAISLTASGVPNGTTVSFNPNPIAAPGNGSSTMTINVGANTAVGTYPITVTGNGGGIQHSTTVTLTVTAGGDYTISASPTSLSVVQGGQGNSTITTTISGGFNSAISLTASGVPNGTTVSFNPNPIAAPGNGSSTMTINVGANTAVGTYPITVTGNGGGIQHSTTVTLTVTAGTSFSISASPMALSLLQGSQGTSTITTTISGGFNSAISLSASGVPSGTIVSFSPNPIPAPGAGQSTMTVTVGMNTLQGTYPIVITGSGGGIQQSVTLTLTVTANVMLSWDASGSQGVIGYNVYRSMATGGPYTKINQGLVSNTNYVDGQVQDGYTYYYVTTAVNQQQQESGYSNEASASVP
jgi:uncharacterized membrane protein